MGLFLICASLSLADFDPDPGTQGDDIPLVSDEYEARVDATHQKTSEWLLSAAHWLDSFFGDDRSILEENTTRVKLRLAYGYSRFDGFDFSPRVNLQLKLPRLSKKALLIIGISDDDEFDIGDDPVSDEPRNADTEKIGFPYDKNHDPNPGVVLRLEADFGFINDIDVFKAVFGE